MKYIISILAVLLTLLAQAQIESYEQMEANYNRLNQENKKDSMLLVARQMNAWALRNEGDTSLRYARSLRLVGNSFNNVDSSFKYWERSKIVLEKQHRESILDYAFCLKNMGTMYQTKGQHGYAINCLKIAENVFRKNNHKSIHFLEVLKWLAWAHDDFDDSIGAYYYLDRYVFELNKSNERNTQYGAEGYKAVGDYFLNEDHENLVKAAEYLKTAESILIDLDIKDDFMAASIYYSLMYTYYYSKEYDYALYYGKKYCNIYELDLNSYNRMSSQSSFKDHYYSSLFYIGSSLMALFKFEEAKHTLEELLVQVIKDSNWSESVFLANIYHNLGACCCELELYNKSEFYYKEALKLFKVNSTKFDFQYSQMCNTFLNLSQLYDEINEYFKRNESLKEAASCAQTAFDQGENVDCQLAKLYKFASENTMDLDSAAMFLKVAYDYQSYCDSSKLRNISNALAWTYWNNNQIDSAEYYYLKGIELSEELQMEGLRLGDSYEQMVVFYAINSQFIEAVPFVYLVDSIYDVKGVDLDYISIDYLFSKSLISMADSNSAQVNEDYKLFVMKAIQLYDRNLAMSSGYKDDFKNQLDKKNSIYLNYFLTNMERSQFDMKINYEFWLEANGWISDWDARISRELKVKNDSTANKLYIDYGKQKEVMSDLLNRNQSFTQKYEEQYHQNLEKINQIERELYSNLSSERDLRTGSRFEDLRGVLNSDEAFVDCFSLPKFDFEKHTWIDSSYYIAYVLTSDTKEAPLLIKLGDGKQMEDKVFPYLMGQITESRSSSMDAAVYEYLWKPLESVLEGKKHIYFSPGGIYHKLNLETIYNSGTGKYLYEEKDIHLVNSGRSFVDQRNYGHRNYKDRTAFLMGSPDFDRAVTSDILDESYSLSIPHSTLRDLSFDGSYRANAIPGTRREVKFIQNSLKGANWKTQLLIGAEATEINLKRMSSPRLLHIATHGFFMEDVENKADDLGMRTLGMDRKRVAENPLLRSGLLLAGCNRTLALESERTGIDNGILTAYEAGLLDLRNTELVVLSACQSGMGEVRNGEGVHGLRKAITDAGAEYLLMSLWKVDDAVTAEYMQTFYTLYTQGNSVRESYNLTRDAIRLKHPEPYYWGAFVLVGE